LLLLRVTLYLIVGIINLLCCEELDTLLQIRTHDGKQNGAGSS